MSFSMSASGQKPHMQVEVAKAYLPATVKGFVLATLDAYVETQFISVSVVGHVSEDPVDDSSCSINVAPVTVPRK